MAAQAAFFIAVSEVLPGRPAVPRLTKGRLRSGETLKISRR